MAHDSKKLKERDRRVKQGHDSKILKEFGKVIEQEQKHWPKPLREKLAALGSLGPSGLRSKELEQFGKLLEEGLGSKESKALGKLLERKQGSWPSALRDTLAKLGPEKLAALGNLGPSFVRQLGNTNNNATAKLKNLPAIDPLQEYRERERALYDPKTWERMFQRIDEKYRPPRAATARKTAGNNLPSGKQHQTTAKPDSDNDPKAYFTISDLAKHWNVSRRTVYRRLRAAGAEVLSFAKRGKRSKKTVSLAVVRAIEQKYTKRIA